VEGEFPGSFPLPALPRREGSGEGFIVEKALSHKGLCERRDRDPHLNPLWISERSVTRRRLRRTARHTLTDEMPSSATAARESQSRKCVPLFTAVIVAACHRLALVRQF